MKVKSQRSHKPLYRQATLADATFMHLSVVCMYVCVYEHREHLLHFTAYIAANQSKTAADSHAVGPVRVDFLLWLLTGARCSLVSTRLPETAQDVHSSQLDPCCPRRAFGSNREPDGRGAEEQTGAL